MAYHVPVLLAESIEGLRIKPKGIYIDLTFGGGGHSRAIIRNLSSKGRLIAFDQDKEALTNRIEDPRFKLVNANFKYLYNYLRYLGVVQVDGILADLGVSSHHFDSPDRGFSYRTDGPLDMRMNRSAQLTAAEVVNSYQPERLKEILEQYGEVPNAKRVVGVICRERGRKPIETVQQLRDLVSPLFPAKTLNKELSKLFQAIRIEVNREIESLQRMIGQAADVLVPGGRFVVISYHSLEDRLVKNFFKSGNFEGEVSKDFYGNVISPFRLVNRKVIVPSDAEIEENPRARSAKLRIGEKV
ncbi:MAG TPA: 16S rRNA (cytosine(1402)-N(4))-methyltransferase RsmH [Tenuifilaceae bacterium]|jgi:16S rRNA (cytosine1402-N4)-methyltransferase|nr:16S rRNA (cytosine(1402)-N(4))-methyltransferase RsmH [Bacteroidales bacterium]MDI9515870.1 16S rRNA (cytosine(1402)-N(4))-methyltransferase RsmH [Bacteroidota bacterium]NLH56267.1 16S rRNA (cytosine(1402)-N(4))-methyltransferase RsmH [Rikenellaceae bacterium]OQC62136.1 MAG: Ribosomal RNA small subunit methyltransferase H [Bacteroidetes bacterium ADurb.Bin008]HNV81565.1 16S rRNA (cytosine(1402)-N(4))-methyltransferase RsmH [Tenuifilaceae bacterium]